jgi:Protein of unknown function (DUF551)
MYTQAELDQRVADLTRELDQTRRQLEEFQIATTKKQAMFEEWISIIDRLPEMTSPDTWPLPYSDPVLVSDEDGVISLVCFRGDGRWIDTHGVAVTTKTTHWMPLPPPKHHFFGEGSLDHRFESGAAGSSARSRRQRR